MKHIIILSLLILSGVVVKAQQDALFTHYSFNTLAVNPGYAGSRDALTVTGLHRSQWVGFEGAPTTQTLTIHGPILDDKIGLGLSILNDKIGPTNTTSLYGDFAYRIPVSKKGTLALGLKGGLNIARAEISSLNATDNNDASTAVTPTTGLLPNFGFGAYYSQEKWYLGFSIPKIIQNTFDNGSNGVNTDLSREQRHYTFIGGFVTHLSDNVLLKPTTLLKVTEGAPVELDLTGIFVFDQKFELGAMFRTGDAVGLLAGYNFTEQLRLGYSFDWSWVNRTFKYNGGSHEVMLRYDFIFNERKKIISSRYF